MRRRNVSAPAAKAKPPKAISHGSPPVAGKVLSSVESSDVLVVIVVPSLNWLLTAPGVVVVVVVELPGAPMGAVLPGAPVGGPDGAPYDCACATPLSASAPLKANNVAKRVF